jgi:hypothetical protein
MPNGYEYGVEDLALLLIRRSFPERTDRESTVIHDFLEKHALEYQRYEFSVRVGQGVEVDPSLPESVQRAAIRNSQKRIDMIVWSGDQPTIIEVKERITPAVLGQLQTYRMLLLEDRPSIREPLLATIGRYSDGDTVRVLQAHGITVYTYDRED